MTPPPFLVRMLAAISKAAAWVRKGYPAPPPGHVALIALCGRQGEPTERPGQ
jgi:hypothetical protein